MSAHRQAPPLDPCAGAAAVVAATAAAPIPTLALPFVPTALSAFVLGDIACNQRAALPGSLVLGAVCAVAVGAGLAAAAWVGYGRRCGSPALGAGPWAGPLLLALLCLGAGCAGFACTALRAQWRLADVLAFADEGRDLRVQGVVASLPADFDGGTRFTLALERVLPPADPAAGQSAALAPPTLPHSLALSWYEPGRTILPAQRWEMNVRLHRPQASMNPGGFDAEAWLLEQGIGAQGTVRTGRHDAPPRLLDERVTQFNPLVDRARARLRERLRQILSGRRHGDVIVALVIGDQGPISEEDWALFNRTGISHLVSISGLHITMIAAAVALLAGAAWRRSPRLLRLATLPVVHALAAILGGYAYCLLAGWGVPAQRTLLMLSVVALGQCWRARLGAATILSSAAVLVCLWDPWAVLAAGFWLSFGAVACILLAVGGRLPQAGGWRRRLGEAVWLQTAITVGQVPLTLAIFGQVSLVAPLANALAIPLVSYLVAPLALIGAGLCVCGSLGAALAAPLLHGAEFLFRLLAFFLQWLTQPSWSWFSLPMPPLWTIACAVLGCAWLLAPPGWPLRLLGVGWLLPMFVWPVDRPGPGQLWVTALDVGQGMSLVLETAHRVVVFDTGPRYTAETDAGGRVLVPYLRARGIRHVDLLFVSHQDIDHAGGASSLLHALPVDAVWSSVDAGHRLLAGATVVHRCEAGQHIDLGPSNPGLGNPGPGDPGTLSLSVLSPPAQLYLQPRATTNAKSCVVLAQLGSYRVLLTGDVPARQEKQFLAATPELWSELRSEPRSERPGELQGERPGTSVPDPPRLDLPGLDLLVAPHHGSHTSSSEVLIATTRPRWVSMQLGYRNHFGHPHPEVVQRYRQHGVAIVRSDESGAAQWRFGADGGVQLERWRLDHAHYWNNQPGARAAAAAADPSDSGPISPDSTAD